MKANQNNLSQYFQVAECDQKWGCYVTTVGELRSFPEAPYPSTGHPNEYYFDWSNGRTLDCPALVYISHGRGTFESRQCVKQSVEAGQVIVLFPGVWHRYQPDPKTGWHEHWVGFDGDFPRRWLKHECLSPRNPVLKPRQEEIWLALFTELVAVIKSNPPASHQIMAGITVQILGLIYSGRASEVLEDPTLLKVQSAIAKMQNELKGGLDMHVFARKQNISYSSFRHSFKRLTGSSPCQYMSGLRLARARALLTQTTQSINHIARQVGFDDVTHFFKFFKRKMGMTPRQWRTRLQPKHNTDLLKGVISPQSYRNGPSERLHKTTNSN